jgi:hypothetical protein
MMGLYLRPVFFFFFSRKGSPPDFIETKSTAPATTPE